MGGGECVGSVGVCECENGKCVWRRVCVGVIVVDRVVYVMGFGWSGWMILLVFCICTLSINIVACLCSIIPIAIVVDVGLSKVQWL